MSSRNRRRHNPQRRPANVTPISMREMTRGNVALADSPDFRAAKAAGTLGPNAGNLPHNVQSTSAATNYGAWPAPPPGTGHPYPDMPAVSDARPLLDQMGATGVAIFSGIITSEEYNPDFYWRDGVKIFDQMLRSDGQINAMRMQVEMPLQRATWSIEPASKDAIDQEIASFVETCLFDEMHYETTEGRHLTQKWGDTLRHILLSLWYGFSAMEVCWRVEDGWVKWARWLPLLPRTVWRWWVGEDNELVGIQQWTFKNYSYQFVEIPADKLLLFVHRQEGNNYEGVSLLRTAYKHWWYKSNFEKIEAIGIERNAVVPAVVYLPENFTSNDLSYAQTVVQNIRANELGGITLPARSTGWDLEYPKNQQRYAMQAQPSIQYHDVMIARNVLAQFLNLGSTETGAYALADSQLDSFRAALQGVADYIEDVVNNDAIRRLVDYNYDGVVNYPKLKCSKIALQDLNRLSTLLQALQSYLPPSPELSDFIAQEIGLPVVPSSVVQTTNPGSPNTPDRPQNQNANNHETDESDTKDGTDVAETPPSEGSGSAGGGQTGGDAAVSSGGSARSGLSEPEAGMSEVRLLHETLSAIYGLDAIERGLEHTYKLYGHPPGYDEQPHVEHGHWGPGNGPQGESSSGGAGGGKGRGRGGAGKGEAKAPRGSGGGRAAKTPEEKLAGLRQREADAHARLQRAEQQPLGAHGDIRDRVTQNERLRSAANRATAARTREEARQRQAGGEESIHERSARLQREGGLAREVQPGEKLTIVGHVDPYSLGPDVHGAEALNAVHTLYGDHQLGAALSGRSITALREMQTGVGAPGASNKADLISSITAHVTGGRYSANFGGSGGKGAGEDTTTTATRSSGRGTTRAPEESIHERSARLQREGGLAREARPGERLVAVEHFPGWYDPLAALDAHYLLRLYGERQLGLALHAYSMGKLREAAQSVGARPGRTAADTVSRITSAATSGRYSANFGGGSRSSGGARGGPSSAAEHEARITALRSQLARAEQEYAAFRAQNGGQLAEHDEHALTLLERIADIESELAYLTEGGDDA